MYKVDYSVDIARPLEQVFEFISNYENDLQWRNEVQKIRKTSGYIGVGATNVEISRVLGRFLEIHTTITDYIPDHKIASSVLIGQILIKSQRTVAPNGKHTRVHYIVEIDTSKLYFYRPLGPYLIGWYQKHIEKYMENLKQVLEMGQFQKKAA